MAQSIATAEIVQAAFGYAEMPPPSSLGDDSAPARAAAALYPISLDGALERADWSFASSLLKLSEVTVSVVDEELPHTYVPDGSILRIRDVRPAGTAWRRDGTYLRADAPGPLLERQRTRLREDRDALETREKELGKHPRLSDRAKFHRRVAFAFGRIGEADTLDLDLLASFPEDKGLLESLVRTRLDWGLVRSAQQLVGKSGRPEKERARLAFLFAGKREGDARRIIERAPAREELSGLLAKAAHLYEEWGKAEHAHALARLAETYADQARRRRGREGEREREAADAGADVVYMQQPLERENVLPGYTCKLKWPDSDHAIYVTLNDIVQSGRRRPFEIFINSKNMEHYAWTVALTRMISAVFRRGGDVSFVVEELKAVFDPRGGQWMGGRYVQSLLAAIGDVDDDEIALGDGAQTHRVCRIAVGHPMPTPIFVVQQLLVLEITEQRFDVRMPESIAVVERQLERCATHVIEKYQQLIRVDARMLRGRIEEKLRMPHHELIQRLTGRHQHADAGAVQVTTDRTVRGRLEADKPPDRDILANLTDQCLTRVFDRTGLRDLHFGQRLDVFRLTGQHQIADRAGKGIKGTVFRNKIRLTVDLYHDASRTVF